MEKILPKAFNSHVHLRGFGHHGDIGPRVLAGHASWCDTVLAIGNTPALRTIEDAKVYQRQVAEELDRQHLHLTVYLALMLDSGFTTPAHIYQAADSPDCRVKAMKLMPRGASTSEKAQDKHVVGVDINNLHELLPVFEAMQEVGLVLMVHAEMPAKPYLHDRARETDFLPIICWLHYEFPKLRMSVEHLSTIEALNLVQEFYEKSGVVFGGVTPHHMCLTWSDVLSNTFNPHHLCRPPVKLSSDADILARVALGGAEFLHCGTDCAPHLIDRKESSAIPCGIYNSPVTPALLATLCKQYHGEWGDLIKFMQRGRQIFGCGSSHATFRLAKEPWTVPVAYNSIIPLLAGQTLSWRVVEEVNYVI